VLLELEVGVVRRLPPAFLGASGRSGEEGSGNPTWTKILNENLTSTAEKGGSGVHVKGALAIGFMFFRFSTESKLQPWFINRLANMRPKDERIL
jgi:hypothetical protein